jgi:hypothetical protein
MEWFAVAERQDHTPRVGPPLRCLELAFCVPWMRLHAATAARQWRRRPNHGAAPCPLADSIGGRAPTRPGKRRADNSHARNAYSVIRKHRLRRSLFYETDSPLR